MNNMIEAIKNTISYLKGCTVGDSYAFAFDQLSEQIRNYSGDLEPLRQIARREGGAIKILILRYHPAAQNEHI